LVISFIYFLRQKTDTGSNQEAYDPTGAENSARYITSIYI